MTVPLAQEFAQVREALDYVGDDCPPLTLGDYCTAISVIERHVQDMEKALDDSRQERDAAMEELESAESEDGAHFCLTTEREWRPCPSSLCEADKLLDQNRKLRSVWIAEKEARFLEVNAHNKTTREAEAMADSFDPIKDALIALAFESPVDDGLCWCPDYWWHDEETGAQEEEHSKQCLAARAALPAQEGAEA